MPKLETIIGKYVIGWEQLLMLLCACILVTGAGAQGIASCDAPLATRAFDISDRQEVSSLALKNRQDVCNSEYDSKGEAESAAMSAGASGSIFGLGSAGGSASQSKNSNKWSLKDTKFCSANEHEFSSHVEISDKKQVASIALATWLKCVEISSQNLLYVSYTTSTDYSGIVGTLHRKLTSTGSFGNITGINVVPETADVTCRFGTQSVKPNKEVKIPIEKSNSSFSCTKKSNQAVRIALITDQTDLWMEGKSGSPTIAGNALQLAIQAAEERHAKFVAEQATAQQTLETRLSASDAKMSSLEGGKLGKSEWPTGSYVILKGSGACPVGFTDARGVILAISNYSSTDTYIAPASFGASSIGVHNNKNSHPYNGDIVIAACVK